MRNPRAINFASVICLIPLLGWWVYGLFDLDEGFYAAVVAEMNRRGEWITPYFNGKPWFEKPILLYWVAKPCLALFGGEFGIRLPSILATLGTYAIVAWFGRRRLGALSGAASALVLATSLFFVAVGRMVLVDPLLILCLTGAFTTFWESLVGDRRWRLLTAALLGLALLAKGPVAGALFIAVLAYTYWRERDLRSAFGGAVIWLGGIAIFAVVVAAWYVPAYLANHQVFVDEFLIKQNLQRFKGGDEAHAVPMPGGLIYYIPIVLIGMIPWSLWVPKAWPRRAAEGDQEPVKRYLATWAVVVFAFFTISGTKLPHYVLPCFPPLALLVGHFMAQRWADLNPRRLTIVGAGAVVLALITTFGFAAYHVASQADGDRIAKVVQSGLDLDSHRFERAWPERVALFRLTRQEAGLFPDVADPMLFDWIRVRVNQTSTPSVLFFLDPLHHPSPDRLALTGPAIDTDRLEDVIQDRGTVYVLTRPGRLTPADLDRLHALGCQPVGQFLPGDQFQLVRMDFLHQRPNVPGSEKPSEIPSEK